MEVILLGIGVFVTVMAALSSITLFASMGNNSTHFEEILKHLEKRRTARMAHEIELARIESQRQC